MDILAEISQVTAFMVAPLALYLGGLALLARRRHPAVSSGAPRWRLTVVVPAHNEEKGIAATVASLRSVSYPRNLWRLVVVADNCQDNTAVVAARAGAMVWCRQDELRQGKGYALTYAFARLLRENTCDAVVVVDADTSVSPNLLRALATRLEGGEKVLQGSYGVRNPHASWRTALMTVALATFHDVRSLAREALGLSAGLRGNGMCFAIDVLREVPHRAFGLVEDVEYGIVLGRAGYRVAFVAEARVLGEMASGSRASASQRQRWEGGRWALARQHFVGLLCQGLKRRNAMLLDLAMDLALPPLGYLWCCIVLGLSFEVASAWQRDSLTFAGVLWGLSFMAVVIYVLRGVQLSDLGARGYRALAWAPVYVLWKMALLLPVGPRSSAWIRTSREQERA